MAQLIISAGNEFVNATTTTNSLPYDWYIKSMAAPGCIGCPGVPMHAALVGSTLPALDAHQLVPPVL